MATPSREGPQIFICYDKTYRDRALALHARLANDLQGKLSRDVSVFIDQENLESGDAWDARIRDALASARLLVVLLNDGLVTRPYCRFEIETFLSRIEGGETCHILPVRWQHDSEVYRTGALGEARAETLDQIYLESLPEEARALVAALREIQFLDGVALREDGVESESFNAAFRKLSAEVTRLYRLAQRAQATPDQRAATASSSLAIMSPASEGRIDRGRRGWSRPLRWGIAAFAAMVIVVGAFVAVGPLGDPPAEVETEPPMVEIESPPRWTAVAQTVENRSGGDVVARRAPRLDAAELEVLGPGAIRPAIGVTGSVMTADIDGVTWLNYPTPIADVRGYVPEADISTPD